MFWPWSACIRTESPWFLRPVWWMICPDSHGRHDNQFIEASRGHLVPYRQSKLDNSPGHALTASTWASGDWRETMERASSLPPSLSAPPPEDVSRQSSLLTRDNTVSRHQTCQCLHLGCPSLQHGRENYFTSHLVYGIVAASQAKKKSQISGSIPGLFLFHWFIWLSTVPVPDSVHDCGITISPEI